MNEYFDEMEMRGWKHLVLGETRWECQHCGRCCYRTNPDTHQALEKGQYCWHYDLKVHTCTNYAGRPAFCRRFPFEQFHGIWFILMDCTGTGRGEPVTLERLKFYTEPVKPDTT